MDDSMIRRAATRTGFRAPHGAAYVVSALPGFNPSRGKKV